MSLGSFMDSFLAVGFMESVQRHIQPVALSNVGFRSLGALPFLFCQVPANGGIVTVQQGE
jgi:hypothetical protein